MTTLNTADVCRSEMCRNVYYLSVVEKETQNCHGATQSTATIRKYTIDNVSVY